jgi:hypothetical protein
VNKSDEKRLPFEVMRAFAEVRYAWAKRPFPGTKDWADWQTRFAELLAAQNADLHFLESDRFPER